MTTVTQTFDIQLGAFRASYHLYETTAPAAYDGFGTISLHEHTGGDPRWVLVRTEHNDWQTLRYRSGMYSVVPVDLDDVSAWATETLYKRMLAGGAQ